MKKFAEKKDFIPIIIIVAILILGYFIAEYRQNRCVKTEQENFERCMSDKNNLEVDCYQYKQAIEEYCLDLY